MDFEKQKQIWNKYNPPVKDSSLRDFLNQMRQIDRHFHMEDYFKKKKLMEAFKYPHADMSQFMEESDNGVTAIYFKSSGFKVFGDNPSKNKRLVQKTNKRLVKMNTEFAEIIKLDILVNKLINKINDKMILLNINSKFDNLNNLVENKNYDLSNSTKRN